MEQMPWWGTLLAGMGGGAVAAFILNRLFATLEKHRRAVGYRESLDAEVDECHRIASEYTPTGISAPLYRLPTYFYHQALPALLADGELVDRQPKDLLLFYSEVETANRGLERIDRLLQRKQLQETPNRRIDAAIQDEFGRITLKTRQIIRYYPSAKQVTSARRPGPFQKIFQLAGWVIPSRDSYLRACQSAGKLVAQCRRFAVNAVQKIKDRVQQRPS